MDPTFIGILGIIVLVLLLFAGVHIGVALGVVGLFGCAAIVGFQAAITMAVTSIYFKATLWSLITVPLFILMGYLAAGGGVSAKLYDTLAMWIGRYRGGLGIATVLGCTGFGTVTGSSVVTTSVFAKIAAPEMIRLGYDKKLAYGICASAGSIGMMVPPSILAIIYGTLSGLSVGKLLLAGIGPGLVLAVVFSVGILVLGTIKPGIIAPVSMGKVTWRKRFASIPAIWPIIIVATVIVGGIFTGVFSPAEAASVATFLIFVLVLIVRRNQRKESILPGFRDTASTSAMMFLILTGATVFSRFLVFSGLSGAALDLIVGLEISNLLLVCLFAVVYICLGTVIDAVSMLAITLPIVQPVLKTLGIDQIWFAMIVILATQIGTITPPVGICVYSAKAVAPPEISLEDIFRGVLPFFIMELIAMAIIIAFPIISTFFANLF